MTEGHFTREYMIKRCVADLKKFGYPNCDEQNIITDAVYSKFFDGQLEEFIALAVQRGLRKAVKTAQSLRAEIEEHVRG